MTHAKQLTRCLAPILILSPIVAAQAVAATSPQTSIQAEIRVAVVGDEQVSILRESDLSVVATFPLPEGWVERAWPSEDGTRLTVLTEFGLLRAKEPADLTIYDLEALKVLGQLELEFAIRLDATADDAKSGFLVFKGRKAKKGQPARPPALIGWNATDGTIVARTPLGDLPDSIHLLEGTGRVVVAFHGESASKPTKRAPGRLEVFDAASLKLERRISLPGPVVDVVTDNRPRLFALDRGTDRKKPEETLAGRVYVMDPTRDELLADLEIGVGASLLSWDGQREVFYVVTGTGKARTAAASFQVVRGSSVLAKIPLRSEPHGVVPAPDRSRYYVLEADGIAVVKADLSAVERRIPLPATPTAMLFLDPPDRAFVSFLASSQVSVVDLAESRILADITIGRTGKKLAIATAAALSPAFGPIPYTVPNPETSGLLSPDGRTAFLINTQTVDLTAVDTESFEVVEKFPGSLPAVVLDGGALAAFKVKDFVLFDLETRKALPEMELGLGASSISPSGRYAWTGLGSGTAVFDLEARRRVKLFPDVTGQIVFVTTQSRETREKPEADSIQVPADPNSLGG